MAQRVNPQVTQKIKELVQEGMTNPHEIRKVLNHYVRTVLCTENPPDPDDRAYFPVHRDLKNHIYNAKLLSKFDLVKKISEWKTTYPDSRHFFRPYISDTKQSDSNDEENSNEFEQTLQGGNRTCCRSMETP